MRLFHLNRTLKRLRHASYCLFVMSFITSCAFAPWEQNKYKNEPPEVRATESQKDFEKNPESTKLRKDFYFNKDAAVTELLTQAEQARLSGDLDAAQRLYERVLSFAPDNQSAIASKNEIQREIEQNAKLNKASELAKSNQLEQAKNEVHQVLLENPQKKSALILENQLNKQLGNANAEPPELKPTTDKPISLELRDANIKAVFEALSRATGINFILDKDIKPDTKATIFIKKLPIEEAIDMVLSSNGLQKKALSDNTALVFPSNQQKLKDYQDLKIRSFYLNNTNAKQVAGMLKSMLKTKDIFIDERINMLVMRDTPEAVRIAEKLVTAIDIADSEVMLEIEILEITRSRLQQLGIVYPTQLGVIGTTANSITLEALKGLNSGTINLSPNPAINFKKTVGDVNLLSNPRIRVKNNEKARILVGDKIPIITTTSTANVGISENVTYIDVGLKLDVEPKITLDDFVNIKVALEVSSLGEQVPNTNTTVFRIGTRNASTVLRLKDGETQILAGLISDDERKNASRIPGLGDIPLIGRLFSDQTDSKSKTEIVLAITPRIITNLDLPQSDVSEYWSGTESVITDKPKKLIPAFSGSSGAPMTPLERLREQRRERQIQLNAPQDGAPSNPAPAAPVQDNSSQIIPGEVVEPTATTTTTTTTTTTEQPSELIQPQAPPGAVIDTTNPPPRF
ncbi:MAG: type II and III secretion system protein [Methylophilaceae bacterium 17-44-8]|nr:MAG: type II and III secretion system protein [Methylophilales bacterium 28-44-11]OZA04902.1 MAG: type II and III secretion system protein [Methylophilaceae bacterium 17-44-8]